MDSDPDSLWNAAQDHYVKGDYGQAERLFEKYVAIKPSFGAMYNLGNCYLESGNTARAILWYERAAKYKPRDTDLRHNLAIAQARRVDPVVEIQGFFAVRWLRAIAGYLSVGIWAMLSLLCFWIIAYVAMLAVRTGRWRQVRWALIGCGIAFVFLLMLGAQRRFDALRNDRAVLVDDDVQVLIAPESNSKLVARINGGETVQLLDSLGTFYKVRLANFEHGWISKESLERI